MKRLAITNDCEGATLQTMRQAQKAFEEYGIKFSESCWVFSKTGVSLLEYDGSDVKLKQPDYAFLTSLISAGKIDTLHTWGDFPTGGFTRALAAKAYKILKEGGVRFNIWTAHGGSNDYQNLAPLGQGDIENSPYYHMDYTEELGVRFYSLNTDIDVTRPARKVLVARNFRRFRGPTKEEVRAITLSWLPRQIELAEKRTIWRRPPDDVVIYTHFYAIEEPRAPNGWQPMEEFSVSDGTDSCLRKLAERKERGELEILTVRDLLFRLAESQRA